MADEERKFNPNDWTPFIIGIGTWLFAMHQAYHGIHYVPDEWIVAIILYPFSRQVYSLVRGKATDGVKRLFKKD